MFDTRNSLTRAAAGACLDDAFGAEAGQLEAFTAAPAVITDLVELANDEGCDLYEAARRLRDRVRPATLASYAAALVAGLSAPDGQRRYYVRQDV